MVSTRPSPTPARGRIAYPSAANYTPGDADNSPAYLGASGPIHKTTSRDSDRERAQGLKTWWKGFREKERAEQSHTGGLSKALGNVLMSGGRGVFGVPLSESIEYASVQVSTSGPDGSLYVWGKENAGASNVVRLGSKDAYLALIFQPGVISHPLHTMRPREHVLSQQVLEFLIEHQDHFLLGMELKRHDKVPSPGPTSPETPSVPTPPAPVKADADLMLPSDSDDEAPAGGYYVIERQEPVSPPTSPPTQSLPSLEAKLVPPPPEPVRPKPTIDFMEPSDSDEDAPPGGYEVRSGDFTGARATMLGKGHVAPSSQVSLTRRRTVPSRPGGGLVTRIRRAAKEAP
ncbi:hypothetical protein CI109_103577 [Kwoniella shandongensis]|uniref:Uncharacterized protein n=1 Tax=Kwoniella shandongensis TaxID=1734106 RepID=A0AAJ8LLW9_9TREE